MMAHLRVPALAMSLATRRFRRELQPRDGFLLVTLIWTRAAGLRRAAAAAGDAGPELHRRLLRGHVSGLTTTGATVLTGLEKLPPSVNVWRCFMVLIGGMGIIVLAVAILPLLGVGGSAALQGRDRRAR